MQRVAFAAPYPGRILAMDLAKLGGELICQKDSFLCAAKGISIGIAFQRKIGAGLFGGEGFIMQRLQGDGLAFVHAGGMLHAMELAAGRDAARRHRLSRRDAAVGQLRHPVRRQGEDGALRRGRAVLRDAHRARARCGCSRCRSAASPIASTRRFPASAADARKKARFSAVWAICSTATSRSTDRGTVTPAQQPLSHPSAP